MTLERDSVHEIMLDALVHAHPTEFTEHVDAILSALADQGYVVVPKDSDEHVVRFTDKGWTLRHPLSCRPSLFDCPVHAALIVSDALLCEEPEGGH